MAKINLALLATKGHFFLLFGGLAALIPFLMTISQQFGASPVMIGIMYSTLPIFTLVSKPLFGSIADKFQKRKTMFLMSIILSYCASLASYFIPLPPSTLSHPSLQSAATLTCNGHMLTFPCPTLWSMNSSSDISLKNSFCNFSCRVPDVMLSDICKDTRLMCSLSSENITSASLPYFSTFQTIVSPRNVIDASGVPECQVQPLQSASTVASNATVQPTTGCKSILFIPCHVSCDSDHHNSSLKTFLEDKGDIYRVTYQIVLLWISMALLWFNCAAVISIGDAVVIDLLNGPDNYGRQRLWGSVSWGIMSTLTGYLVDVVSAGKSYKDFTPAYGVVLVCGICHLILAFYIKVDNSEKPQQLWKNVGILFQKPRVATFTFAVFLIGCLTGILWTFVIVYLNELHASQLLIGLHLAVQGILGEIPFFFFSSWFLKKIGHENTMVLVLAILGLRSLGYSLISNPWTVLPIELTQGITFGLFYAALATYPTRIAPPNLQATLQGILQGTFEGLGVGTGSFIAGVLYQHYGGRMLFIMTSVSSFTSSAVIAILLYAIHRRCHPSHNKHLQNGVHELRAASEIVDMLHPKETVVSNHLTNC